MDMGVWQPFARRVSRSIKFRAWLPSGDGTYICRELPGPANYMQWLAAWQVLAVAALRLQIVSRAALDAYQRHIEKLVTLFPEAWHLVAMTDDRRRSDHLVRIKRQQIFVHRAWLAFRT